MHSFVYNVPVKVYFGQNQLGHLGEELKRYGTRVLMTYGGGSIKRSGLYDTIVAEIKQAGLELFELSGIEPNPRIDTVREGAKICKEKKIDVLLAVGGGSTLDATKWIAAGACVDHDPWDFLDRSKLAPVEKALPVLDVLTLAATGYGWRRGDYQSGNTRKTGAHRIADTVAKGILPGSQRDLYCQQIPDRLWLSRYPEPCHGTVFQPGTGPLHAGLLHGRPDENRHQVCAHGAGAAG